MLQQHHRTDLETILHEYREKYEALPPATEQKALGNEIQFSLKRGLDIKFSLEPEETSKTIAVNDNIKYSLAYSNIEDIRAMMERFDSARVPFSIRLSRLIEQKGFRKDSDFYKKLGVSRQHFSKIMGRERYIPRKNTIMAMTLVLKLSEDEALELLKSAGYSFSDSEKTDLVVKYCLNKRLYDLFDVNEALIIFEQKPLLDW